MEEVHPLWLAIKEQNVERVECLVSSAPRRWNFDCPRGGFHPLFVAPLAYAVFEAASLNFVDSSLAICRLLVNPSSVQVSSVFCPHGGTMPDLYFGFETATSLFLCASLNAPLSFCKELVDSGADVNALGVVKRGKLRDNHTAFCAAVYANRFDLVDLMLGTGKCNLEAMVLKAGVKWSLQSLVGGRIDYKMCAFILQHRRSPRYAIKEKLRKSLVPYLRWTGQQSCVWPRRLITQLRLMILCINRVCAECHLDRRIFRSLQPVLFAGVFEYEALPALKAAKKR
jgi:hypothetical protein